MPRLLQRLRRALQVEPGEGRLVVVGAVTLFLIEWASVAVSNASDTLFLKRVGIDWLPVVFLLNSVLLTGTTLAAGRLVARLDQRSLLLRTFVALAGVLVSLWGLVVSGAPGTATTLMIASKQIDVIAALMFWTVLAGVMSSRQGKRLVALMTAGGTLGTIAGSFSSGVFGRLFGIPALMLVAAVAYLAAAAATLPVARIAGARLVRRASRAVPEQEQPPRLRAFWAESSLFRVLAATSFLAGVLGPIVYFEFSSAADLATRTADGEQKLLALYGQLRGWINVGVLAVQVGGSAALFRLVGVPLASMLAPAAYVAGLGGLATRFGLPTAMPATMGTSVIDHTIYEPAQRILAALLPMRMRTAATSVIQGPAKRAGAALGCVLILAVLAFSKDPSHVALAATPVALAWMALALALWRNYPNLLLEAASVRTSDPEDDGAAAFLDPVTLRTLQQNLESPEAGLCRAACSLFVEAPAPIAVDAMTKALAVAPAAHRPMLFETLDLALAEVAAGRAAAVEGADGPAARPEFPRIQASSLLRALASAPDLDGLDKARLLHLLGVASARSSVTADSRVVLKRHCDSDLRCVALSARLACVTCGIGDASAAEVDAMVDAAFAEGDDACRRVAIVGLRDQLLRGDDRDPAWAARLARLVSQVSPAGADGEPAGGKTARALAVEAVADVARWHRDVIGPFAPRILALSGDPDPFVRAAVLRFVGHARLVAWASLPAERLASRNAAEAAAARRALESFGPAAVEALLHALRHGSRRGRVALAAMLKEIRVEPEQLRRVVDRELEASRELLVQLGVFEASGLSRLLLQRVRERVDEGTRVVLELMASLLDDDRIADVCRSMGPAWSTRDRAVLLEALEALLPAADGARILPLLEDHGTQRMAADAARALGRRLPTLEEALADALASRDALTGALVLATVDRRLLEAAVPELDADVALRVFSGQPSAPGADGSAEGSPMLNQVETMLHLRSLDWFEGLSTRELSSLARAVVERKVGDGQVIVAEGDFDDRMYFIVSGRVRIEKAGQRVAALEAPDIFGEMSVFDGERRSATATADGEVRLLALSRNDLFEAIEDQPTIGIGICQTLVRRVRNMLEERSPAPGA